MMLAIEEKKRTECRFTAFFQVVFRNAVCTYFRDLGRKYKREIFLEYLTAQTHFEAHSTDDYSVRFDAPTDFAPHPVKRTGEVTHKQEKTRHLDFVFLRENSQKRAKCARNCKTEYMPILAFWPRISS